MTGIYAQLHSKYLNYLIHNLQTINENPNNICSIIKEATWLREGYKIQNSLCDLIILYYDSSFLPIELKHSTLKRNKALQQISQGYDFGINVLNQRYIRPGKIVYYKEPFKYESVEIPSYYKDKSILD